VLVQKFRPQANNTLFDEVETSFKKQFL